MLKKEEEKKKDTVAPDNIFRFRKELDGKL